VHLRSQLVSVVDLHRYLFIRLKPVHGHQMVDFEQCGHIQIRCDILVQIFVELNELNILVLALK